MIQMCQDHWNQLRKMINDAGLTHLVSPDAEHLQRRIDADPECKTDFDPLWHANGALLQNALRCGGLELMADEQAHCPVCLATQNGAPNWLDLAVTEVVALARERGLIAAH